MLLRKVLDVNNPWLWQLYEKASGPRIYKIAGLRENEEKQQGSKKATEIPMTRCNLRSRAHRSPELEEFAAGSRPRR